MHSFDNNSTSSIIFTIDKCEGQKCASKKEVEDAKNTFRRYKWPTIDVTRKSVEETAASIIKIYEIFSNKKNG